MATEPTAGSVARRSPARRESGPLDEELVRQALGGRRDAFERLVQRHQRPLVNHLFRMTGQRDGALDLAQEVFIKVYLSLAVFDPRYRFTTWLYRIASNCAIDHLRRRHPQTCSLTRSPDDDRRDSAEDSLPASEPTPDDLLRARELQARIERAIRALPNGYRQLILLRHHQHCRYDEIARITNLPLGTVKNRIFRAREMLRGQLADHLDGEA